MKLLVSTAETQGQRDTDFCHVPAGELLMGPVVVCDTDPDGACGCMRSLSGIDSRTSTTTLRVVQAKNIDRRRYRRLVLLALQRGGWTDLIKDDPAAIDKLVESVTDHLIVAARSWPVGTILEKRGYDTFERRGPEIVEPPGS